jgi:hypothetical protein
MSLDVASFAFGALLFLVALVGGGIEIQSFKIPPLPTGIRYVAGIAGVFFLAMAFVIAFIPKLLSTETPTVMPTTTPTVIVMLTETPTVMPTPTVTEQITITLVNDDCKTDDYYVDGTLVSTIEAESKDSFAIDAGQHTIVACRANADNCGDSIQRFWPKSKEEHIGRSESCPVTPTPIIRKTLFEDDFSSPDKHKWSLGDWQNMAIHIVDGKLQFSARYTEAYMAREIEIPDFSAKNFGMGFDVTVVEASSDKACSIGVFFRNMDDNTYYVRFWQDRKITIDVKKDREWKPNIASVEHKKIVLDKGVKNRFDVFAQDETIMTFVDGQLVFKTKNNQLDSPGKVKLSVDCSEADQSMKVEFDNLVIVDK